MAIITHTTDEKARINLPKTFANSTILVEQVSDTELRIRKARIIPEDEIRFVEEGMAPLSDRDRDVFLALLDTPPSPNEPLRRLLSSVYAPEERGSQPVDVMDLSWADFFDRVMAEQHPPGHALMQERLQTLREIRRLFAQKVHFRDLDYMGRRKIAGLFTANPSFLLFGGMRAVGQFKQAIRDNNDGISLALDEIPLEGDITLDHYQGFTDHFLGAFERAGMALASRLLAMKRPDTFVCLNNQNKEGLLQAFRLSPIKAKDAKGYWSLIERVRACAWWKAPPPSAGDEREAWGSRAAFLDALFFTGAALEE